jgi:hypothetical protein
MVLGLVFRTKPMGEDWESEHPTWLTILYAVYAFTSALISFATIAREYSIPGTSAWQQYERFVYLTSQSSGASTAVQFLTIWQYHIWWALERRLSKKAEERNSKMSGLEIPLRDNGDAVTADPAPSFMEFLEQIFDPFRFESVNNGAIHFIPALVLNPLFAFAPMITHGLPMYLAYVWVVGLLMIPLFIMGALSWNFKKTGFAFQAAILLLITMAMTILVSVGASYGVIFYGIAQETPISSKHYWQVMHIDGASRASAVYFRCVYRQLRKHEAAAADFAALFG